MLGVVWCGCVGGRVVRGRVGCESCGLVVVH